MSPILSAAASPAFLAKGCVNVVELDALKEIAGERWPRIRDGVYARLEFLLRSKLGPNDLFVRLGETAYLITMPTTDADDVSAICTRVAFDLHMSFLGECGLAQIHVDAVVGGEDDALVLRRLPATTIAELAERVGIADLLAKPDGMIPTLSEPSEHSQNRAPYHRSSHGNARGRSPAQAASAESAVQIEHHFLPVWSVPNAAVTTYICTPKAIRVAGRQSTIPASALEPRERLIVEMSVLRHGIAELTRSHQEGKRFLLNIPLSFDVFGPPAGRMEVLSACREMPHDFRSFITYVISNVPLGVGQTALANMVTALNPFGRAVVATVHPATRAFSGYQGIGLKAVGYDVEEFPARAKFAQDDAERLAQFARRNNLGTFLNGICDKNVLKYAQDAGIQYLCGPAVAPPTTTPRGMWRLDWAQVLAKPEVELWV
jgi:GGDEF domain-containing protein